MSQIINVWRYWQIMTSQEKCSLDWYPEQYGKTYLQQYGYQYYLCMLVMVNDYSIMIVYSNSTIVNIWLSI